MLTLLVCTGLYFEFDNSYWCLHHSCALSIVQVHPIIACYVTISVVFTVSFSTWWMIIEWKRFLLHLMLLISIFKFFSFRPYFILASLGIQVIVCVLYLCSRRFLCWLWDLLVKYRNTAVDSGGFCSDSVFIMSPGILVVHAIRLLVPNRFGEIFSCSHISL